MNPWTDCPSTRTARPARPTAAEPIPRLATEPRALISRLLLPMLLVTSLGGCINSEQREAIDNFLDNVQSNTGTGATNAQSLSVTIDSPATYQTLQLSADAQIYVDRSYLFTAVPAELDGAIYIQTANDDKFVAAADHLQFTTNVDASVFVLYSGQISQVPGWLAGWSKLPISLTTSHAVTYEVYRKDFAAGTVSLGGNEMGFSSYAVAVTPLLPAQP